jgi:hypothetical protein
VFGLDGNVAIKLVILLISDSFSTGPVTNVSKNESGTNYSIPK